MTCFKCGCKITFDNFKSSMYCKSCSDKTVRESNRKAQRKWYQNNKAQAKENEYDRRDRGRAEQVMAEKFISTYNLKSGGNNV